MAKILLNGLHYEISGAGISKYTNKLIDTFIKENYDIDILMRQEFRECYNGQNIFFADEPITSSRMRIIQEQLKNNKRYKRYQTVHFTDYATPVFYTGGKIATIHDMAMHTMRDKYTFMQNMTKNILLHSTIRNAEKLICVSEFTKKELLRYYPQAASKVQVIYEGIDPPNRLETKGIQTKTFDKFNISQEFILYVGTIAPHKNITTLIKAYANLRKNGYDQQLVIAGKKGWMYDEVFTLVKQLGIERDIIFTGFVSDEELEVLYSKAVFFITLSLYEGFGFPPLEAMIRRCPVLVSDIEVFRETCGDNVLYCAPNNIEDVTSKMVQLIKHKNLRLELVNKGEIRAKVFTWEQAARQTYKVYEEVNDNPTNINREKGQSIEI